MLEASILVHSDHERVVRGFGYETPFVHNKKSTRNEDINKDSEKVGC